MNKLITIIGCPGSGKSTLVKIMGDTLPAKLIPADDLYKSNPFFSVAVNNRERWSFSSDLWFLLKRIDLTKNTLEDIKKTDIVIDSGIPMSLVYTNSRVELGHLNQDELDLYMEMYQLLEEKMSIPSTIVYLKASPEFLLERIKKRGREFEIANYTSQYLQALTNNLEHICDFYQKKGTQIIEVESEKIDFISNTSDVAHLIKEIKKE